VRRLQTYCKIDVRRLQTYCKIDVDVEVEVVVVVNYSISTVYLTCCLINCNLSAILINKVFKSLPIKLDCRKLLHLVGDLCEKFTF